jgi:hypothetical protein
LFEAKKYDAELGLFLVHEFRSASPNKNKLMQYPIDWENFVHAFPELATARIEENQILDPVSVPGGRYVPHSVPLYLRYLVTELEQVTAIGIQSVWTSTTKYFRWSKLT